MRKITLFLAALLISMTAFSAKLYLTPSANWKTNNARYAAYFFGGTGEVWISMTEVIGATDVYEVEVPTGRTSVIFCRMDPSTTANNLSNKWNQTADLTIPSNGNNLYTVKADTWDNDGGTWSKYTPSCKITDGLKLYMTPSEDWKKDGARFVAYFFGIDGELWVDMTDADSDGVYEVTCTGTRSNVIFVRMKGASTENNWDNKLDQTSDLSYDCDKNHYSVATTSWSTYTPEPSEPEVTYTVYFDNTNSEWEKVYAYCWNSGGNNSWPGEELTVKEGNVYTYTTTVSYENIIFNNGSGAQTADLVFENGKTYSLLEPTVKFTNSQVGIIDSTFVPTVEVENIENPTFTYTMSYNEGEAENVSAEGYQFTNAGSYVFTVVVNGDNDVTVTATHSVSVFYLACVAGSAELCNGQTWYPTATENVMTLENDIYTITYENVPVGSYEFKVVYKGNWLGVVNIDSVNSTPGFVGADNIAFTLPYVATITISYNPTTNKIILVAEGLDKFGEFIVTSYTLCGSKEIFVEEFNTTLVANDMVETNGVWAKTYENVVLEKTQYYYKVAANHTWNGAQYPAAGNNVLTIEEAGKYNLIFTYEPEKTEGEKLTCGVVLVSTATMLENVKNINVYTQNGMIIADGEYQIYTITGQNVTDMNGNLENGVYIVKSENSTVKVVVK